jgi:hypothetical protein
LIFFVLIIYFKKIDQSKIFLLIFLSFFIFVPTIILTFVYLFIICGLKGFKHSKSNDVSTINNQIVSFESKKSKISIKLRKENDIYSELDRLQKTRLIKLNRNKSGHKLSFNFTNGNQTLNQTLKLKRRQTISICLVSLFFFFCVIPIKLFQVLKFVINIENLEITHSVFLFSKLLFYTHIMSNPIVYNLMSSKFSRSFRKVLFCKNFKCI